MDMVYLLQDSIKNSLRGINPASNQYMLNSYLVHGFTYGLDTISINPTDLDIASTMPAPDVAAMELEVIDAFCIENRINVVVYVFFTIKAGPTVTSPTR